MLEHLLIQHLTEFFNVGEHKCMLLEGADWNDGMDMARTAVKAWLFRPSTPAIYRRWRIYAGR